MGRNEIRLRKHTMSEGRFARYKNYSDLIARHERDRRAKLMIRLFIYSIVITFLLILAIIFMVVKWQRSSLPEKQNNPPSLMKKQ